MTAMSNITKKDRGWFHNWLLRRENARQRRKRKFSARLKLEQLESRDLMSGVWTALNHAAQYYAGNMMLLSDGTVMVQDDGQTNSWRQLTPDASGSFVNGTWSALAQMTATRQFFPSNVLPSGKVFVVGGEFSGQGGDTNTSETYDPVAKKWASSATFPQSRFGDDPTEILPNGNILAGYIGDGSTYIYNTTTNSWSFAATKVGGDRSDEETWVKLTDGSILSYDVNINDNHAQRYLPSMNKWVDAGVVPVPLTSSPAYELGPALLLPDGRVFQVGANGNTALYTPSTDPMGTGTHGPPALPSLGEWEPTTPQGLFYLTAMYSLPPIMLARSPILPPLKSLISIRPVSE
jgi:hypothetical protein